MSMTPHTMYNTSCITALFLCVCMHGCVYVWYVVCLNVYVACECGCTLEPLNKGDFGARLFIVIWRLKMY